MKNILVIAAHPDDEVLGCGATICKYSKNTNVNILFISDGVSSRGNKKKLKSKILSRKKSALKSAKILGVEKVFFGNFPDNQLDKISLLKITKLIEKHLKRLNPKTIITHHFNDLNVDHRKVSEATITACRPLKSNQVGLILFFEVLSSTEWQISDSKKFFNPNWFEDISNFLKVKKKALACYNQELKRYPHSRSFKGVEALARYRGISSGYQYAEGFVLGRKK